MSLSAKIAAWVYGLHVFIILPWFLGAIYRHEQSLWAWDQYAVDLRRHGEGNAFLGLYLYFIFYSAFIVVPYALLGLRFSHETPELGRSIRLWRLVLSVWFAATFLLFANPLFEFIRSLPSEVWNGWLLILWGASTVFVFRLWMVLEKKRRKTVE